MIEQASLAWDIRRGRRTGRLVRSFFPVRRIFGDRGSQLSKFIKHPLGLSHHGSGDIHGSRPDTCIHTCRVRGVRPGCALHGYDPMSSRVFHGLPDLLPTEPGPVFRRLFVRASLLAHRKIPPQEIDRPLHPHCKGQSASLMAGMAGEDTRGRSSRIFLSDWNELADEPWHHKKVLKWYKDRSGPSKAGIER